MLDKAALLDSLRAQVSLELQTLERQQKDVQAGATHEESRSEHAKDTRATEQSYLARGLAERVAGLRRTATALAALELRTFAPDDPIAISALVTITSHDEAAEPPRQTWFVVPGPGGIEFDQAGTLVRTVTPLSPLGRALQGLSEGDEGIVRTPRGKRSFDVLKVLSSPHPSEERGGFAFEGEGNVPLKGFSGEHAIVRVGWR